MRARPDWSFIIPCRNEAAEIGLTIERIASHVPSGIAYEVVVVDHGSTDGTVQVAKSHSAKVVSAPGVTLGQLRNRGAHHSSGKLLIFIDADVSLTSAWSDNILTLVDSVLSPHSRLLTGSLALPDPNASWVALDWERGRARPGPVKALGGGHMIIAREYFLSLGGFPEHMDAGEDEGLCERVWQDGGRVVAVANLPVIHRGAPQEITSFAKRQYWHGLGDARSLKQVLQTRMAVVSVGFVCSLVAFAFLPLVDAELRSGVAISLALIVAVIPALATMRRNVSGSWTVRVRLWILYFLCFLSRGAAVLAAPFEGHGRNKRSTHPNVQPQG